MAFNIKAYYEDSKDYYGNVPLEEVAVMFTSRLRQTSWFLHGNNLPVLIPPLKKMIAKIHL